MDQRIENVATLEGRRRFLSNALYLEEHRNSSSEQTTDCSQKSVIRGQSRPLKYRGSTPRSLLNPKASKKSPQK
eukprot:2749604-Amphidinium_carterae.2